MYRLLMKYSPSRYRWGETDLPKFQETISRWVKAATHAERLKWICSFEKGSALDNDETRTFCNQVGLTYFYGAPCKRVERLNRDIDKASIWDCLVTVDDDFTHVENGWDERIDAELVDTKGAVWFYDGWQCQAATMATVGRHAFEDILGGQLYDSRFKAAFADCQYTRLLQQRGRLKFVTDYIFAHGWKMDSYGSLMYSIAGEDYMDDKDTFLKMGGEIIEL